MKTPGFTLWKYWFYVNILKQIPPGRNTMQWDLLQQDATYAEKLSGGWRRF